MQERKSKRVLVIGASALQIPAIVRAQELGHEVGVVDRNSSAPGVALAQHYFEMSTTDAQGVTHVARSFRPDAIITIGTDMPMRSLAAAALELGLPAPSPESILNATDKGRMAQAMLDHAVPMPWTVVVTDADAAVEHCRSQALPVIVKPADSSGSRGVTLVETREAVTAAFDYAHAMSGSGRVLVQEYMRGPEVSVEGFCFQGETAIVAITDKITTGTPHFVELGHSQPSQLDSSTQTAIREVVAQAVAALTLSDCAFHAELIVTADGPKIVEVGARLGGDFITSHLVPLSTGVDMIEALLAIALGERPRISPTMNRGSAVRFLSHAGSESSLIEARALPGVELAHVEPSSISDGVRSSTDRLGHIVAGGQTVIDAVSTAEVAVGILLVENS